MEESQPIKFEFSELDIEIFTKKNGEDQKLDLTESFEVELTKEAITIDLKKYHFIRQMQLQVEGVRFDRLKADYHALSGAKVECVSAVKDAEKAIIGFDINDLVQKVYLFYKSGFFEPEKIRVRGIRIYGTPLSNLEAYIDKIALIETYEADSNLKIANAKKVLDDEKNSHTAKIAEFEAKEAELTKKIKALNTQVADAESRATTATTTATEKDEILKAKTTEIEAFNTEKNKLQQELSGLKSDIERQQSLDLALKNEVQIKESQIRELVKKYSLYSNEYASYNKQGNKFILLYTVLSALPAAILCLFIYKMFRGTVDLTVLYKTTPDLNLTAILVTRLPFVTISLGIISVCFYTLKYLTAKIFDIQDDKMILTKLSILAQDIVKASAEGLTLSDSQLHEANIYLRMELLKSYMQGDIDRNFQYKARNKKIMELIGANLIKRTSERADSPEKSANSKVPS
jgi:hypothetical protein